MRRPARILPLVALGLAVIVGPVAAQQPGGDLAPERKLTAAGFPLARAYRVDGAPELDGEILGEAIWSAAVPATGF